MLQDLNPSTFSSQVIFMYWVCENHTLKQRQPRNCNNVPSFSQWTTLIARSFCEGCTWHHLHILVTAPLWCDWKSRAASAQSFLLWHQAVIKIPRRANLISACSPHVDVVLQAHPVPVESHIHHNVFVRLDIDSSLQTNDSKWLDNSCDSTLTRSDQVTTLTQLENFLDDSDSKGLWLWLDSDSTKMTRTHHCP